MARINNNSINKILFKNTGIIAIGQVSTKLINFFLLPLYTTLLTKEEYGTVDLLSTYAGVIAIIVGMQINQAAFRFLVTCRNDEKKSKEVVSTIVISTGCAAIIYTIVFILVAPFIQLQFKWYLLIHVIAALYLQTSSCIARGFGKNAVYATGNFISASTALILNVITIAILHLGIGAMLSAYVIGLVIGGTFVIFKCRIWRYIDISKVTKEEFVTIIKYAIPLIPNELSWSVIHASDRIVISSFLGIAANGLIAVAAKFSTIYTTAFSIFNTSWTEQVVLHYKDEGGPEYICNMFDKMVTFFGCIAIGIIVCMPFVFKLMVNEQFSDAYNLVPLYMIAVFFNAVIGMISAIYLIENETKKVATSTAVAAAINILVDILLVRFIGIYAAPISSICGYAVISFWRLYDVNKRHCRISISLKKSVVLLLGLVITVYSYYSNFMIVHIGALMIIAIISFILNKQFLNELVYMVLRRNKNR